MTDVARVRSRHHFLVYFPQQKAEALFSTRTSVLHSMRTGRLFSAVLVPLAALLVSMAAGADDERATKAATHHPTVSVPVSNSTNSSSTSPPHRGVLPRGLNVDNMVIQRALYVLIGFTMLGVFYLLVRAVRMKRPLQKKKYGLLKNCDDVVELDPLESEEDDTLYEASALRR